MAPLLVVCIGIAGAIFGQEAAQDRIAWQIQNVVGYQGGQAIQALLQHADKPSEGIVAAVVGFFMLLFGASGVFGELRDSFNLVWGVKFSGGSGLMGMIKYRFASFAMVLGIGFLLLVSLVLSAAIAAAGKLFSSYLPASEPVLHLGNIVFTFVAVTVLFALLYKVVPDVRIEWRDVWIGAAVTSILFSVGKFLIGLLSGKSQRRLRVWRRGVAGHFHGVGLLLGSDLFHGSPIHPCVRGTARFARAIRRAARGDRDLRGGSEAVSASQTRLTWLRNSVSAPAGIDVRRHPAQHGGGAEDGGRLPPLAHLCRPLGRYHRRVHRQLEIRAFARRFYGAWILINLGWIPGIRKFDPYPFMLLAMMVSLEAIFLLHFRADETEPDEPARRPASASRSADQPAG